MSSYRSENLVSASDLITEEPDRRRVFIDVRQGTNDLSDLVSYRGAHIPGAIFADIDRDLAGRETGSSGKRPLPEEGAFEATLRRWGIEPGSRIVVYGAKRTSAPARAWWLLRWAGLSSVQILDGGIEAWVAAGGPTVSGDEKDREPSTITIRPGQLRTVTVDDVPGLAQRGILLDARPAARFAGDADPSGGHIPEAVSAPVQDSFDLDGKLKSEVWLREHFRAYGVDGDTETGAYCGTGVAAALEVFVLATLGIKSTLYVGSWSEWTADASRPIER